MQKEDKIDLEAEKRILKDIHVKMLVDHTTDVDKEMQYIAEDAILIPPNMRPIEGAGAIREAVNQMVKTTKIVSMGKRDRGPSRIEIASSGDLAYDIGKFQIVSQGPEGPVEEKGYYVTLYKKIGGQWKFLGQIWNNIT